jgi:hypothetical protein
VSERYYPIGVSEIFAAGAGGSKQPVQVIVGEGFDLGRADQILPLGQVAIRYKLLRCLKETGHPDSEKAICRGVSRTRPPQPTNVTIMVKERQN